MSRFRCAIVKNVTVTASINTGDVDVKCAIRQSAKADCCTSREDVFVNVDELVWPNSPAFSWQGVRKIAVGYVASRLRTWTGRSAVEIEHLVDGYPVTGERYGVRRHSSPLNWRGRGNFETEAASSSSPSPVCRIVFSWSFSS